jgi:valyl-tRNA synthetase
VERVTAAFESYEYAQAKVEIENFFWRELTDNYMEMAKLRLYSPDLPDHTGARDAIRTALRTLLKLLAPLMPYITEEIWRNLFAEAEGVPSIHQSPWPETCAGADAEVLVNLGDLLIGIASTVRRYKSEHALSLGSELQNLQIAVEDPETVEFLRRTQADIASITRARSVVFGQAFEPGMIRLNGGGGIPDIGILP